MEPIQEVPLVPTAQTLAECRQQARAVHNQIVRLAPSKDRLHSQAEQLEAALDTAAMKMTPLMMMFDPATTTAEERQASAARVAATLVDLHRADGPRLDKTADQVLAEMRTVVDTSRVFRGVLVHHITGQPAPREVTFNGTPLDVSGYDDAARRAKAAEGRMGSRAVPIDQTTWNAVFAGAEAAAFLSSLATAAR
jgi:hypothetical protein